MKQFMMVICCTLIVFCAASVCSQVLQIAPTRFYLEGQSLELSITGIQDFDSIGVSLSYELDRFKHFFDTTWEASPLLIIDTPLVSNSEEYVWGSCDSPDSITFEVVNVEQKVCTTAYYDWSKRGVNMIMLRSRVNPVWPMNCWKTPRGYKREKNGITAHMDSIWTVNFCGDSTLKVIPYNEDLWEFVPTPTFYRDTIHVGLSPMGFPLRNYIGHTEYVNVTETLVVAVVGFANSALAFQHDYWYEIRWDTTSMGWRAIDPVAPIIPTAGATVFSGLFNLDLFPDVGFRDTISGNVYLAYWDTTMNRFIPQTAPAIVAWAPGISFPIITNRFNADSLTDLCRYNRTVGQWSFAYCLGDGNFTNPAVKYKWAVERLGRNWQENTFDMDGDGDGDLVVWSPKYGYFAVAENLGVGSGNFLQKDGIFSGFWESGWALEANGLHWQVLYGDVNGDGKDDAIAFTPLYGRTFVAENRSNYFQRMYGPDAGKSYLSGHGVESNTLHYKLYGAHINLDNKIDLIFRAMESGQFTVATSLTTKYEVQPGRDVAASWLNQWANENSKLSWTLVVQNFDRRGGDDIAAFTEVYGSLFVCKNRNNFFERIYGPFTSRALIENFGIRTTEPAARIVPESEILLLPREFALQQNYPNPFNPSTTIEYSLPKSGHVRLEIINILGQQVRTLVDEDQPAGEYSVMWLPFNCASGIYFYRLKADGFVQTKKMILLK